ncbi:hypothetical protein Tco_0856078 [Tanacetum coccineum]
MFDFLLKSEINKNEDHILRPSTVAITKKLKELIQKDELTITDLEAIVLTEVEWNSGEGEVSKLRSFERHMSKSTKPHPNFYNNDLYYLVNLSTGEKYTTSLMKHYAASLDEIHYWEDGRQDFFKAEINNISPGKVYSDKRITSVVRVVVKRK